MSVARLGALAFNVTDMSAWRKILVDILGMEERPRTSESDPVLIRFDELEYRIALYPSDTDGPRLVTWEVDTPADLKDLADRVAATGTTITWNGRGDNDTRDAVESFTFLDPEGFATEIRYGATHDHNEFRPSSVVSGFVTGDMGLGHLVVICKDYAGTVDFYSDVLGFKVSDYIVWDGADATFFHCNGRHHSLALMNECFGQKGGDFNHFMVEVNDLDDTGRAYELIKKEGVPLRMELGRHTNDGMTSFYLRTPSGFAIEVGNGGIVIDDANWEVKTWRAPARWGHELVAG
jgi:3,4-dihydroxy-9,10-secoandrosta-1,3,5(10)-triene-9,17-dione 4,5-dioxygenase